MNIQESDRDHFAKIQAESVKIKFTTLFVYVAAYLLSFALIGTYLFIDWIAWVWLVSIFAMPVLTAATCRYFVIFVKETGVEVRCFWWSYEVEYGSCMRFCPFWFSPVIFCDNKDFNFCGKNRFLPKATLVDKREVYKEALKRLKC